MYFKEMKASDRAKLIEGQKDVLTGLVAADAEIYDSSVCPRCEGIPRKEADIQRILTTNRPIPRYLLRCNECECLYDPFCNDMIIEMGNRGRLVPEIPFHIDATKSG